LAPNVLIVAAEDADHQIDPNALVRAAMARQ